MNENQTEGRKNKKDEIINKNNIKSFAKQFAEGQSCSLVSE